MKKISVLFLVIFVIAVFSASVFADGHITCNSPQSGKVYLGAAGNCTDKFGLSAHVTAAYCSSTGNSYAAATYNSKGTKTYGTGSGTSNIYYKSGDHTGDIGNNESYDFESNNWTQIGE